MADEDEKAASAMDEDSELSSKPVLYGMHIKLLHLETGQYLSVRARSPSLHDKDAFRAMCWPKIRRSVWFKIMPTSLMRAEGERVRVGDSIKLENVASGRVLHASDHEYDGVIEVNGSTKESHWFIEAYDLNPPSDPNIICVRRCYSNCSFLAFQIWDCFGLFSQHNTFFTHTVWTCTLFLQCRLLCLYFRR